VGGPASGQLSGPASGEIEAGGGAGPGVGAFGGQAAGDPADGVSLTALALGLPECVICIDGDKTHLVRASHGRSTIPSGSIQEDIFPPGISDFGAS
jgi:hypothetical protein